MLSPNKKIYHRKPKTSRKFTNKSDPITVGVKASILSKIDTLYQHIETLNAKNSFLKTFSSSKSSLYIANPSSVTQRKQTNASSLGKTVQAEIFKSKNSNLTTLKRSSGSVNYSSQKWAHKYNSNAKPFSQINIRQLLHQRCKIQQMENNQVQKNPYYKIMKKRVKTQFREQRQLNNIQNSHPKNQCNIKTQFINDFIADSQDNNLLRSNYSFQEKRQNRRAVPENGHEFDENHGPRQKSDTKVYEEIKKYFQQKYGNFKQEEK